MVIVVAALLLIMLHVSPHLVGPAGVVVAVVITWCLGGCFAASVAWADALPPVFLRRMLCRRRGGGVVVAACLGPHIGAPHPWS